jgi:hypothetical protein
MRAIVWASVLSLIFIGPSAAMSQSSDDVLLEDFTWTELRDMIHMQLHMDYGFMVLFDCV